MKLIALTLTTSAFFAIAAQAGEPTSFTTVDTNGDGFITENEYVSHATAAGDVSEADAMIRFIVIDADASGAISPEEMDAAGTLDDGGQADDSAATDDGDM